MVPPFFELIFELVDIRLKSSTSSSLGLNMKINPKKRSNQPSDN